MCLPLSLIESLKVLICSIVVVKIKLLLNIEYAEADAFFCFSCIMIEIGDKFNKLLDTSPTGYSKLFGVTKGCKSHLNVNLDRFFFKI